MGAKIWLATGADHRGAEKLQQLQAQLSSHFPDLEIAPLSHARPGDNFNLPAARVTEAVLAREAEVKRSAAADDERQVFGLLICGSGHGMCMQANRYLGARAINAPSVESAREGRAHSDANILCLAADYLAVADMVEIVRAFLTTPFAGEPRFVERIQSFRRTRELRSGRPLLKMLFLSKIRKGKAKKCKILPLSQPF